VSPSTTWGSGKPGSGPLVRYDRGPTQRTTLPKSVTPKGVTPSAPSAKPGLDAAKGKGGVTSKSSASVKATHWRDVSRSNPTRAKEILTATRVAGRAHEVAAGVAAGSIGGGVYAGGYRGGIDCDDVWVSDPWCWSGWTWGCGAYWGGWWGSWCWWGVPWYWSCYYPAWWAYSYPYYYNDYCYYPITSVVYSEPQVVYAEPVSEAVGEVAVAEPQPAREVVAPPVNPLSIASQRYLELGDRAFREGRYTDAVQFYAKAVEFAPDQGALYLVLSDALFAAGDYHYGAYAIRRALELDPALIQSEIDKHGFYHDPRLFDEQLAALERYVNEHPSDRDARLVLALNYLLGGRPVDSVRVLESTAAFTAEDHAAQVVLARALELTKR
jgi:hypothetical protein